MATGHRTIDRNRSGPGRCVDCGTCAQKKNDRVPNELRAGGSRATTVRLDVTECVTLEGALAAAERELGAVNILVNNAGIGNISGGILNESAESWDPRD